MIYKLDFKDIYNKETLYSYLKKEFKEYEFYGNNLDALMEVLICLKECELIIENVNSLRNCLGEYADRLKETFLLASKENEKLKVIVK